MKAMPREVIVTDDDRETLDLVRRVIEEEDSGAHVSEAWNGQEAFAAYLRLRERLAMVVTGLHMTGMTGYDLALSIRGIEQKRDIERKRNGGKTGSRVPIVLISGDANQQAARDCGCDVYLKKPVEVEKMRDVLSAYLYNKAV